MSDTHRSSPSYAGWDGAGAVSGVRFSLKRRVSIVQISGLIILGYLLVVVVLPWQMWVMRRHRSQALTEAALSRLHMGMRYVDATRELRAAEGFWRHTTCGFAYDSRTGIYFTSEAFFYGNRDPDEWVAAWLRASGPSVEDATLSEFGGPMVTGDSGYGVCDRYVEELPPN